MTAVGPPIPIDGELPPEKIPEEKDGMNHVRSIWISDIHLGTRGCKSEYLLDFLRHHESQYLYLVGDIIDGWQLKRSWNWPQAHNDIVQKILRKVRKGTEVFYIPGNHDAFLRTYDNLKFGGVTVANETIHTTADGRRLLVMHGDMFDSVILHSKWLAVLGSEAYDLMILADHWLHRLRWNVGLTARWSLSGYIKSKVKNAVNVVSRFEEALVHEAKKRNVNGIVCGHIHKAELRPMDGVLYANAGDWIESCSALVEHLDGRLELVFWTEIKGKIAKAA